MLKSLLFCYSVMFFAFIIFSTEVKWQNPVPPTNILNDVFCPSPNTAIAVGNKGVILRTKDNGSTWDIIKREIWEDLTRTFFVDSINGWIAGLKGTLVKTSDGGLTWEKSYMDTATFLFRIFFFDQNRGWLEGSKNISGNRSFFIYKTTNGGSSWQSVELQENTIPANLYFYDSINGISITSGTGAKNVIKTSDGGMTWIKTGVQVSGITPYFINGARGWVIGGGRISSTIDSGKTWIKEFDSSGLELISISFSDSLLGCAVGTYSNYVGILYTINGGSNWNINPVTIEGSLRSVNFYNNTTGFAVGNNSNLKGVILRSKYNGTSWEVCGKGTHNDLFAAYAIDSQVCFASGRGGIILKTEDGGANWLEQRMRTDSAITGIYFVGRDTGWAVGWNGYVIKTIDGGKTWQEQKSNTTKPLYRVYFVNPQVGYIGGDSATILRTADGGEHWQVVTTYFMDIHTGLCFTSASTGFSTPFWGGGRIMQTNDSGKTWNIIYAAEMEYKFVSIDFADSLVGYALCHNSGYYRVYGTVDGGSTWSYIADAGTNKVGICVKSRDTLYINSLGGVWRSINSGKNWEFITPLMGFYTDEAFQWISFAKNSRFGWAVGTSGAIIKITEDGATAIKDNSNSIKKASPMIRLMVLNKRIKGSDQIDIRYILKKPDTASIRIFTIKGALVGIVLHRSAVAAGAYTACFNVSKLGAGKYICKLESNSGEVTQQFEVVR